MGGKGIATGSKTRGRAKEITGFPVFVKKYKKKPSIETLNREEEMEQKT